ncbi:MAG: phosphonate ABC transporter ATP-binding protein [Methylibium sp.]|nr:phosphonate ABC transporter ATP-binding protein [Methylibium sp.]MBA3623276.1 phosphonate ABC transporter ATP-binding protein [Methylibium sp.]
MQPILCTHCAQVVYRQSSTALHPTTLSILPGQLLVLLGSSGAGKSTLLRTLNGLVRPTAGTVEIPGIGSLADPAVLRQHRRTTGMVFQQHHLIGRASVLSNVLTGRLGYHGPLTFMRPWADADKTLALAAIDRVGLLAHALQRADELSGGQQQRVGIARALVQHPKLILADEPVASLDPATALDVMTLLRDICRADRITAVVSLHQVHFAKEFADRIVGLNNGRVVFDGAPEALTTKATESLYANKDRAEKRPQPASIGATALAFETFA